MDIDKIYLGDCLKLMQDIPEKSIDCIICDLPYGTTSCQWDILIPFDKLWEQYDRIIKDNGAVLLFGQEPFSSFVRMSNLKNYKYDIYWQKERITNIQQAKRRVGKNVETISIFYKKQCTYNPQMLNYDGPHRGNKIKDGKLGKLTDNNMKRPYEYVDTGKRYPTQVWKFKRDILTSNLHPTQKPLLLIEELVKTFTNEGDTVLDNCMGSGTTAIACLKEKRHFIGMELNKEYYDIACERIKKEQSEIENSLFNI